MKLTFICKRTGGILMLILLLPLPLFAKKMTAPQGETHRRKRLNKKTEGLKAR